jgi:cytochrome c peroxidase
MVPSKTNRVFNLRLLSMMAVAAIFFWTGCKPDNIDNGGVPSVDLTHIAFSPKAYQLIIPPQYPRMQIPADNLMTEEGVDLGRFLFYDPILSIDSSISCASCHKQELAFTDGVARSRGVFDRVGTRNSMSLVNIGFVDNGLFWDGRVKTLEEQALHPIIDPLEMGETLPAVLKKIRSNPVYQEKFRKAFGVRTNLEITASHLGKALAQFQRSIVSFNSKFDRYTRNEDFLEDDELDGYILFFFEQTPIGGRDAECSHCHIVGLFSGDFRHNGLVSEGEFETNPGRFSVTGNASDKGKFRSVTLRNIALTAPYMHDGRIQSLRDVIDHYATGGHATRNRDPLVANIEDMKLTSREMDKIISFLHTLTDSTVLTNPAFSNPFQ